jgi:U2 small nuclear ribonucleoprotein A'
MRLTPEVLAEAPIIVNGLKQRTLVLRNLGLVALENLELCKEQVECIDLCDNEIFKLDNLPTLPRLKSIVLANNKIGCIAVDVVKRLPNLESLVLTNNRIRTVEELRPIEGLKYLERISLTGNPVVELDADYVAKLGLMLPRLRFVDGVRVSRQ